MTPEMVEYYRAMLLVGIRDKFDAAFDRALETEEPLSDLVISLSTCVSDDNHVLSVLREYTLNHTIDEKMVYDMILDDLRSRYLAKEMTRTDVVDTLYRIVFNHDKFCDNPWHEIDYTSYALELFEDGIIREEVFNQCFDAWFFQGKKLNIWKFHEECNKKSRKGARLWHFLRRS